MKPINVPNLNRLNKNQSSLISKNYNPTHWSIIFDNKEDIVLNHGTFKVYHKNKNASGPLILMIHGAGFSALSWSMLVKNISSIIPSCQFLAVDLRGHGETYILEEDGKSMFLDDFGSDIKQLIDHIYPESSDYYPSNIILIGHSLGGAIVTHVAANKLILNVSGIVVIDVVEGSALEALSSMTRILSERPSSFKSLPLAIEWSVRSHILRNVESAKISFPGQLVIGSDTQQSALSHVKTPDQQEGEIHDIDNNDSFYTWRINLQKTKPYWKNWFNQMSAKFLSAPCAKLLCLAGTDRLDKDLTIGQMQGKFQLNCLTNCGHVIHEDVPEKLADVIATFLVRNRFVVQENDFNKVLPCC